MKKVFNNIAYIAELFVRQKQSEAMTPLTYIQGKGKGRRFYFRGDTAYSYRDSFPLARKEGNTIFVKDFCPSMTTKKHRYAICAEADYYNMNIVYSDDLKTPMCNDRNVEKYLKSILNARSKYKLIQLVLEATAVNNTFYPVTKSKFPILFDKKHDKLKQMLFSRDYETFDLARKIIKKEKLV